MTTCSLGLKGLRPDQLKAAFAFGKEYFLRTSRVDESWRGSGVVICGGGRYLQWALNNVKNIRRFDGKIPIQVWCLNEREIPSNRVFADLGAEVVNAQDVLPKHPMRKMGPWGMKMWAVLNSPFQNVLFLDADCFCTQAGLAVFETPEFVEKGAIFCSDVKRCNSSDLPYFSATIQPPRFLTPKQEEFETGAFAVDKARMHPAVRMTVWCSEHQDSWWSLGHGDKMTTEIAWRGMKMPYHLCQSEWKDWGIRHTLNDQWLYAHMLGCKRGKAPAPDLGAAT